MLSSARRIQAITLIALLIRVILAPTPGYDLPNFKIWQAYIGAVGLPHAYTLANPPIVYPPGYLYLLQGLAFFYQPGYPLLPQAGWSSVIMKAPLILADVLVGLLIFYIIRSYGAPLRCARLGYLAYLLNPGVIFNTAYWGGIDVLMGLPVLGAVFLATAGQAELAFLLATVAFLTKYQAGVILPFIALLVLLRCGFSRLLRGIAVAALATLVIYAPFALTGNIVQVVENTYGSVIAEFPYLTVHAHNIWWILSYIIGYPYIPDGITIIGGVSLRTLSLLSLGVVIVIVCRRTVQYQTAQPRTGIYRARWLPFAFAAILALAFFGLATEMHENYLYLVFPFMAVVAWQSQRLWITYWLLSIGWTLNMVLHDPVILQQLQDWRVVAPPAVAAILALVQQPWRSILVANMAPATLVNALMILVVTIDATGQLFRIPRKTVAQRTLCHRTQPAGPSPIV